MLVDNVNNISAFLNGFDVQISDMLFEEEVNDHMRSLKEFQPRFNTSQSGYTFSSGQETTFRISERPYIQLIEYFKLHSLRKQMDSLG